MDPRRELVIESVRKYNSPGVVREWLSTIDSDLGKACLKVGFFLPGESLFRVREEEIYYHYKLPRLGWGRMKKYNKTEICIVCFCVDSTTYYSSKGVNCSVTKCFMPIIIPLINDDNFEAIISVLNDIEYGLDNGWGNIATPFLICEKFECTDVSRKYFSKLIRMSYQESECIRQFEFICPPNAKLRKDGKYPDREHF